MSAPPDRDLAAFEDRLGYRFRDRSLLETALRHASRANEDPALASNERLEFLGDSVVGLVVAHRLFTAHSDWEEGDLTRALHALVDKRALAQLGGRLELAPMLELGRTEQQSGGSSKRSIIADAMEAVIAAVFLDGGLEPVGELIEAVFADAFAPGAARPGRDPKTELQELSVARWGALPSYRLVEDSGIEGDPDRFLVEVEVAGGTCGRGSGRTKRGAERLAAETALAMLPAEDDGAR